MSTRRRMAPINAVAEINVASLRHACNTPTPCFQTHAAHCISYAHGYNGLSCIPCVPSLDGIHYVTDVDNTMIPQGVYDSRLYNGCQGPQGPDGVRGAQGNNGLVGLHGKVGYPGDMGAQGVRGHTGPNGIRGYDGIMGAQGYPGLGGHPGIRGLGGNTGLQGVQGNDGPSGADTMQGVVGVQGSQGIPGANGVRGVQGYRGTQGMIGPQGSFEGLQGATGAQGIVGELGLRRLIAPQPQHTLYVSPQWTPSIPVGVTNYFTTIQAAIDSITDASATNPYLIVVYPGIYTSVAVVVTDDDNITSNGAAAVGTLVLKPFVNIRGYEPTGVTIVQHISYTPSVDNALVTLSNVTLGGTVNAPLKMTYAPFAVGLNNMLQLDHVFGQYVHFDLHGNLAPTLSKSDTVAVHNARFEQCNLLIDGFITMQSVGTYWQLTGLVSTTNTALIMTNECVLRVQRGGMAFVADPTIIGNLLVSISGKSTCDANHAHFASDTPTVFSMDGNATVAFHNSVLQMWQTDWQFTGSAWRCTNSSMHLQNVLFQAGAVMTWTNCNVDMARMDGGTAEFTATDSVVRMSGVFQLVQGATVSLYNTQVTVERFLHMDRFVVAFTMIGGTLDVREDVEINGASDYFVPVTFQNSSIRVGTTLSVGIGGSAPRILFTADNTNLTAYILLLHWTTVTKLTDCKIHLLWNWETNITYLSYVYGYLHVKNCDIQVDNDLILGEDLIVSLVGSRIKTPFFDLRGFSQFGKLRSSIVCEQCTFDVTENFTVFLYVSTWHHCHFAAKQIVFMGDRSPAYLNNVISCDMTCTNLLIRSRQNVTMSGGAAHVASLLFVEWPVDLIWRNLKVSTNANCTFRIGALSYPPLSTWTCEGCDFSKIQPSTTLDLAYITVIWRSSPATFRYITWRGECIWYVSDGTVRWLEHCTFGNPVDATLMTGYFSNTNTVFAIGPPSATTMTINPINTIVNIDRSVQWLTYNNAMHNRPLSFDIDLHVVPYITAPEIVTTVLQPLTYPQMIPVPSTPDVIVDTPIVASAIATPTSITPNIDPHTPYTPNLRFVAILATVTPPPPVPP